MTAAALPEGPAGDQVRWLFGISEDLDTREATKHFTASMLGALGGPDGLAPTLTAIGEQLAGAEVRRTTLLAPHHLGVLVALRSGEHLKLEIVTETTEPFRVAMAQFSPVQLEGSTPWPEVAMRGAHPGNDWIGERITAVRTLVQQPGVAAALLRDGEVADFRAAGVLDLDTGSTPAPDTVFRIGSVSKLFTGVGVMQLVESGLVDLDGPANRYLTSFQLGAAPGTAPGVETAITVKHLLTHTSGLSANIGPIGVPDGQPLPSIPDLLGPVYDVVREPGTYEYSNGGFATLGQLIADVSGVPFEDYMIREVFDPIGMTHTDFVRSDRVVGEIARGYSSDFDVVRPAPFADITVRPAGSMFSTAIDMAKFADSLCNGGRGLLRRETLELMLGAHAEIPGTPVRQGLVFVCLEVDGTLIAWHNGGWAGANTEFCVAPDKGVGLFMAANVHNFASGQFDALALELLSQLV